jgi:cytochrome c
MDSFELNKILGAILGTLLFVMGVGFVAEAIYHPVVGNGPGYALAEPEETGGGDDAGPVETISIATLLASADPKAGEGQAKKCQACHDLSTANANKTGPGLYDIVERVIGSHPGFAYSAVMQGHQAAGDTWTYEALDHFLTSPKGFAPGTKMTFAGVKNDQERANIIAFLSTLSASPKPFPAPDAAEEGVAPPDEQVTEGTSSVEPDATADEPSAASEEPVSSEAAPASSAEPAASEAPAASEEPAAPVSEPSSEAPAAQ